MISGILGSIALGILVIFYFGLIGFVFYILPPIILREIWKEYHRIPDTVEIVFFVAIAAFWISALLGTVGIILHIIGL